VFSLSVVGLEERHFYSPMSLLLGWNNRQLRSCPPKPMACSSSMLGCGEPVEERCEHLKHNTAFLMPNPPQLLNCALNLGSAREQIQCCKRQMLGILSHLELPLMIIRAPVTPSLLHPFKFPPRKSGRWNGPPTLSRLSRIPHFINCNQLLITRKLALQRLLTNVAEGRVGRGGEIIAIRWPLITPVACIGRRS